MTPSQASAALRKIALKLENSKSPDRRLVVGAIKHVMALIASTRTAGMSFEHDGKDFSLPWNMMDELLSVLAQADSGSNDPSDSPLTTELLSYMNQDGMSLDPQLAARVHSVIKKAFDAGEIGMEPVGHDSLGRTLARPSMMPVLGGSLPLDADWSRVFSDFLKFLE